MNTVAVAIAATVSLSLLLLGCTTSYVADPVPTSTLVGDAEVTVGSERTEPTSPSATDDREVALRAELSAIAAAIEQEYGSQSPIERFFGTSIDIDRSELEAALNAQLTRRAAYHTQCVRDEGFDWFREPPEIRLLTGSGPQPLPDDSGFLMTEGYGPSMALHQAIDAKTNDEQTSDLLQARETAFYELSVAEQEIYRDVNSRCRRQAYNQFPDADVIPIFDFSAEIGQEISQVNEDIAADPRFDAIWQDWSTCMRNLGYEFETRSDADEYLAPSYTALEIDIAVLPVGVEVPEAILDRLAEFDQLESATLLADLECAVEVDLDRRRIELQHRLEEETLAENADRWSVYLLEGEAAGD